MKLLYDDLLKGQKVVLNFNSFLKALFAQTEKGHFYSFIKKIMILFFYLICFYNVIEFYSFSSVNSEMMGHLKSIYYKSLISQIIDSREDHAFEPVVLIEKSPHKTVNTKKNPSIKTIQRLEILADQDEEFFKNQRQTK